MRIPQPHRITIVRAKGNKSAGNNTTTLDYSHPDFTKDKLKCYVQAQDLSQVIAEEGTFYPLNILIWTYTKGFDATHLFEAKDMIDATGTKSILGVISGKYIVSMVTPAIDTRGKFSHMVMKATRDESK